MNYAFKLEVTETDILRGERWDMSRCPIGRSAQRYFEPLLRSEQVTNITVALDGRLYVHAGEECFLFKAAGADRFLERFDLGLHVVAQTFYYESTP